MSNTQHAEWLSLLDISGPFLSPPVLDRVFPQGLEVAEPDHAAKLRLAREEWAEEQQKPNPDPAIHDAWIRFVLTETLGLTPEVLLEGDGIPSELAFITPVHGERVRPDFVVFDPEDQPGSRNARLLISVWSADTELDQPVDDSRWTASPIDRMVALCRAENVALRLGLVTNGERWALVDAPIGETSAHASWYANLWSQEQLTLRAFRSLLGLRRFFGVAEGDRLEAMLIESTNYQADVTDQLGFQVRRAVEVLVQAIDRADADTGRMLLADTDPARIYEAALTVMMRLVFLFSAEERGLLRLGDPMYNQFYAVSTLGPQLREAADQVGEEVLERRQDAWSRLLGTFRAIHAGVHHEALQIIPYGSSLFDPDRFPFLEGRTADTSWREVESVPLPIDNRTVLLLLESLQLLDLGPGKGARKLSFRALDIEQIGHVYETLLDHSAYRATETMVSLQGNQGREPEISVSRLHELVLQDDDEGLIEFLSTELKKGVSPIRRALEKTPEPDAVARLRSASGSDDVLLAKLLPFHDLIRRDPWGDPVVIREGTVFVTTSEDRRSTGTHYTPRVLTEEIVQYALEPLVYRGPAEGKERDEWELRSPEEILDLKICDPAMGSGAFLVQACRYLSERLVEAWEHAESGDVDTGNDLLPADPEERLALARRMVVDGCLYGVDVNPLAVEMAKLSLWLVTLAKDKPFTFVDHALRCGDSLLGIHSQHQVAHFAARPEEVIPKDEGSLFSDFTEMEEAIVIASEARRALRDLGNSDLYSIQQKARLLDEAETAVREARLVCDAVIGWELRRVELAEGAAHDLRLMTSSVVRDQLSHRSGVSRRDVLPLGIQSVLESRRLLHWLIEFPEVFQDREGFDAMVANPPFLGGKRISGAFGSEYREHLTRTIAQGKRGNADLSAFFLLRMNQLIKKRGTVGSIATNTIGQGDTREIGLDQVVDSGARIFRADATRKWPGGAAVEVAVLWLGAAGDITPVLDGRSVPRIGTDLAAPLSIDGMPQRLDENRGLAFQGTIVLGEGYMLDPRVAQSLIADNPQNREVLKPYINGLDLNSRPDLSPSRWAIDFGDRSSREAAAYKEVWNVALRDIKPDRESKDAEKYPTMVEYWWRHWNPRPELYQAIAGLERTLAVAATSSTLAFAFLPTNLLYSNALYVIALDGWGDFAVLQSIFHDLWVRRFTSSLKGDVRYTSADAFETFPRPEVTERMKEAGRAFYEARQSVMADREVGLTAVHSLMHDPEEASSDVKTLRGLSSEMDEAVRVGYQLDLELHRVHRQLGDKVRWTLPVDQETHLLSALLELNHDRSRLDAGRLN